VIAGNLDVSFAAHKLYTKYNSGESPHNGTVISMADYATFNIKMLLNVTFKSSLPQAILMAV